MSQKEITYLLPPLPAVNLQLYLKPTPKISLKYLSPTSSSIFRSSIFFKTPTMLPPVLSSETFQTTRLTLYTELSFDQVLVNLYKEIGNPSDSRIAKILADITSFDQESLLEFEEAVKNAVGDHGFMIFNEYNHGRWTPLFKVGESQRVRRIVLGNPLKAITMLKYDLRAGLAVPVEVLVLEKSEGGTDIIWNLPSSLVVGGNDENEALVEAAKVLDERLEDLLKFVCGQG